MSGTFDAEEFLNGTLPGSNSTKREVVPPGVYKAFISKLEIKNGLVQKEGSERYGQPWVALNLQWTIEGQPINVQMDQSKVIVYDSVMLDLDEEGKVKMEKGKNVQLGRLREALGLNTGPIAFRAFEGRPATIFVLHEIYKGEPQAKVDKYAKA